MSFLLQLRCEVCLKIVSYFYARCTYLLQARCVTAVLVAACSLGFAACNRLLQCSLQPTVLALHPAIGCGNARCRVQYLLQARYVTAVLVASYSLSIAPCNRLLQCLLQGATFVAMLVALLIVGCIAYCRVQCSLQGAILVARLVAPTCYRVQCLLRLLIAECSLSIAGCNKYCTLQYLLQCLLQGVMPYKACCNTRCNTRCRVQCLLRLLIADEMGNCSACCRVQYSPQCLVQGAVLVAACSLCIAPCNRILQCSLQGAMLVAPTHCSLWEGI